MEKMWYYVKNGSTEKQGPLPEKDLRLLISSNQLSPSDMLWTEGLPHWTPLTDFPELLTETPTPTAPATEPQVIPEPIPTDVLPAGLLGWMQFIGVMNVVFGIISCLCCVWIITGVFMIIGGSALLKARAMLETVTDIQPPLIPFFEKLKTFMLMNGIAYIITLCVGAIALIVYFSVIAAIVSRFFGR